MNEIRPTQTPTISVVSRVDKVAPPEEMDKPAEVSTNEEQVQEAEPPKMETVEKAVTEINEYIQSIQRDLHFSVDEDSGLTVIRVKDKESGELIRQIPEDIFLSLARNLKENQPIHLFDTHG